MKKLTAGIFTVLIGLCAANSADAAVASKGYADAVAEAAQAAAEATTTRQKLRQKKRHRMRCKLIKRNKRLLIRARIQIF